MPANTSTTDFPTIPRVPLKEMDAAMLAFELSREVNRIHAARPDFRDMIMSAAMVATHLHRNQTRMVRSDFPRVPYIEHPLRVALRLIRWGVTDPSLLAASLLHDTVEDCAEEIIKVYAAKGFPAFELLTTPEEVQTVALSWIHLAYGLQTEFSVRWATNPPKPFTWLSHIEDMVARGASNLDPLLLKASDLVDNAGSLAHQYGHVPDAFVIKMVKKYAPGLKLIEAELLKIAPLTRNRRYEIFMAADALSILGLQLEELAKRLKIDLTS